MKLGAFSQLSSAQRFWQTLRTASLQQLSSYEPRFVPLPPRGLIAVRLSMASQDEANRLCQALRAQQQACMVRVEE